MVQEVAVRSLGLEVFLLLEAVVLLIHQPSPGQLIRWPITLLQEEQDENLMSFRDSTAAYRYVPRIDARSHVHEFVPMSCMCKAACSKRPYAVENE